jgi:hypothetical protein
MIMKMYSFDDKAEQVELSHAAIRVAGHEVAELDCETRVTEEFAVAKIGDQQYLMEDLFREIRVAVAEMAKEGGGIITDLMFHNTYHGEGALLPPAGLLVAMECVRHGVPVVVCTDEYHHGDAVSWIFDGFVRQFKDWRTDDHCREGGDPPPFGWVEDKDWDKAVALLAAMRAKMDRPAT